jgi:23S rRNA G2445 N2-methylase RlmL
MNQRKQGPSRGQKARPPRRFYEAEVAEGLEKVAAGEMHEKWGGRVQFQPGSSPGSLLFDFLGKTSALFHLKTVHAIYSGLQFFIPRPKALLGHQNFHLVLEQIERVRALHSEDAYKSLYLSAAGSESSVLQRFQSELGSHTGLEVGSHEGDLLLRLRRSPTRPPGWDLLVRVTPRPLSTRPWRVCDMEGALNASVAAAMVRLTDPKKDDEFLNLTCGSGTLMIERMGWGPARRILGCDRHPEAVRCALDNLHASGTHGRICLTLSDCEKLPLPPRSVDVIVADLPFGHLVGSHQDNLMLYPRFMAEAARVARPEARFVLITHEVSLMRQILDRSDVWDTEHVLPITLSGLHPRIYVLHKV